MGEENQPGGQESGGPEKKRGLYDRPDDAPSPARMFEVATEQSKWTAKEKAWLAMNPRWIEHELALRQTLKELDEDRKRLQQEGEQEDRGKGFVNRLKPKEGDKEQGPEGHAP